MDRYLGIPLLFLIGAISPKRRKPIHPQRIGILKTRAIGDAVLSSVLTQAIRQRWPEAHITYFADEMTKAAAPLIPAIDEIVEISATRPWRSIAPLRRAKLDILFDLGSWPRIDALLAASAKARFTIGFSTTGQHRHFAFDLAVTHRSDVHETQNYINLLAALEPGVATIEYLPALQPPNPFEETEGHLADLDFAKPYVVFHPWAGGSKPAFREWPEQNWLELGNAMLERNLTIVISGGFADLPGARRLAAKLSGARTIAGQIVCLAGVARLQDMFWVSNHAVAVISVNTGLMHVAAASGARVIGLHGPTNPSRWGPLGPRAISVAPNCGDCGFLHLGFEYDGKPWDCMSRISASQVVRLAMRHLQGELEVHA